MYFENAYCTCAGMPLDNVHVESEHHQVTISWSDCSNIHEVKKGYKTIFECVSQWDGSRKTGLIWALSDTSQQNLIDDLSSNLRTFQVTLPTLPDTTTLIIK